MKSSKEVPDHDPNCRRSPTGKHIYSCEGTVCTCKYCGVKQKHLLSYYGDKEKRMKIPLSWIIAGKR